MGGAGAGEVAGAEPALTSRALLVARLVGRRRAGGDGSDWSDGGCWGRLLERLLERLLGAAGSGGQAGGQRSQAATRRAMAMRYQPKIPRPWDLR
jgi:hypothetical protein